MATKKEIVARNIATMLHDGDFVNLGVGLPAMASNYLSKDITIWFHGENGAIGQKEELPFEWDWNDRDSCISWLEKHGDGDGDWRTGHRDLTNANDAFITLIPGGCCFDTVMSFTMARRIEKMRVGSAWAVCKWTKRETWPTGWFPEKPSAAWAAQWTW